MDAPSIGPYADDGQISDDTLLVRRVRPQWVHWNETSPSGQWPRISSQNFQDYNQEMAERAGCPAPAMSVAVLAIFRAHRNNDEELLIGYEGYGLALITAGDVRALQQGVTMWPNEDEPWHALVFSKSTRIKSVGTRSRLAEAAVWLRRPIRLEHGQ